MPSHISGMGLRCALFACADAPLLQAARGEHARPRFFSLALKKREKPARASRLIYLHVNNKQQVFNQQTAALTIILQQWLNYRTFLRTFDFKRFIRSSNETNFL